MVEGGLARAVRKLSEQLVREGAEVHVLTRGGGRLAAVEDRHGVKVHRVREPTYPKGDVEAFIRWVDHMNADMLERGLELSKTPRLRRRALARLARGGCRRAAGAAPPPALGRDRSRHGVRPPSGMGREVPAIPHPRCGGPHGAPRRRGGGVLELHARPHRQRLPRRAATRERDSERHRPRRSGARPRRIWALCARSTPRPTSGSSCSWAGSSTRRVST